MLLLKWPCRLTDLVGSGNLHWLYLAPSFLLSKYAATGDVRTVLGGWLLLTHQFPLWQGLGEGEAGGHEQDLQQQEEERDQEGRGRSLGSSNWTPVTRQQFGKLYVSP